MGSHIFFSDCPWCSRSHTRGVLQQLDSDLSLNGQGVPVCPYCLGTGLIPIKKINSKNVLSKWHAMSIMVNKIRKENETLAIRSEFLLDEDTDIKFKENNKKIINIMKEALAIVGNKAPKNCYARLILKN